MAVIGAYLAQIILNVSLKNSASFVSPTSLGLGLAASAVPTSSFGREPGTSIGYTPQAIGFASVGAAGTKATNSAAITFAGFNTKTTYFGMFIKDTLAGSSLFNSKQLGNLHYFGAFSSPASLIVSSGDTVTLAIGALSISLA